MEAVLIIVAVAIGVVIAYFMFKKAKSEAESARDADDAARKVRMSDPILRSDIEALEKADHAELEAAILLRRRQIEDGRHPEVA